MEKHTVTVNGQPMDVTSATLADLLRELAIAENTVVAEVNGEIAAAQNFAQTHLQQGDTIELVRFVGGG